MKYTPGSTAPVARLTLQVSDLGGASPSVYDPITGSVTTCFADDVGPSWPVPGYYPGYCFSEE